MVPVVGFEPTEKTYFEYAPFANYNTPAFKSIIHTPRLKPKLTATSPIKYVCFPRLWIMQSEFPLSSSGSGFRCNSVLMPLSI